MAECSEVIELDKVSILEIKNGDTLVVCCDTKLTSEWRDRLKEQLYSQIPILLERGVKVLVLEDGITLKVLRHANKTNVSFEEQQ